MLNVTIQCADEERTTALAAARGVLKRFAAEVEINGEAVGSLEDVLSAEREARPSSPRRELQERVLAAKTALREVTDRLTLVAAKRELTDEERAEYTAAAQDLTIAKRLRGKPGDVKIEVPPGNLGLSAT